MTHHDADNIEALVVSGVTLDRNIAKLTLTGLQKNSTVISEIFAQLGTLGVNVDIIVHDKPDDDLTMRVGFTIAKADLDLAKKAIHKLVESKGYQNLKVSSESGLAKVSVVGTGMRSYSGVAGRTFSTLTANDVDIQMISTSEIKISVVVDEKAADKSVTALHQEFIHQPKS